MLFGVISMDIQIECDAISNTDFGRRFCFYRHINIEPETRVTIIQNPIADEKRELIFDNCTLYTLPSGMFEQFPFIRTMYVWNAQLKMVEQEIFRNANFMLELDLSKNRIEQLTAHTFSFITNLKRMDLSQNQIKSIDVNTFFGLEHLNILNIENNKLQLIPANVFATLPKLKTIRLNHNSIKTIPVELFARNLQLENIYLNDNAIEWMVGEQTFHHLPSVREFDLHNNPILNLMSCVINAESIDIRKTNAMGCYIGARTKRVLANDNRISFIDTEMVDSSDQQNLQHIDLANNKLNQIKNLTHFRGLKYLDLSNNKIIDIGLNSFANMNRLEMLNLRNSGLHRIYFGSFSHKNDLKTLDISFNQLNHIDFRMFNSMPNLKDLYLDGNNLTVMDMTEVKKIFPSLTKIGVSVNRWPCDNLASIIKYIDSNNISLSSNGNEKNHENIKGIPCNNPDNFMQHSIDLENEQVTPIDIQKETKDCKNQMELILHLLDLKYETQTSIDNIHKVFEKVEKMIDLLQIS